MLGRLAASATGRIEELANESRISLAVTGLSRAGKTVFITSLVTNLLALGAGFDSLPAFSHALGGRLRRVRVLADEDGAPAGGIARFDYAAKRARMAAPQPEWPAPTDRLARVSLALDIERHGVMAWLAPEGRLRLDILDYPGEWLLDLPLLDQSFARWSAATLARLATPPRDRLAAPFLAWLATLDRAAPPDDATLAHGALLYRESLRAAADRGLRYLQPGLLLAPPRADDPPFFHLFPLSGAGPVASRLAARFRAYQRDRRHRFFDPHFRHFDRQLVLVDLLSALAAGRAAFEDTAQAIAEIARGLRHGWGGWGGWHDRLDAVPLAHHLPPALLGGRAVPRPIGHTAFVATKADHVPEMRRDNLRNLLRALAGCGPTISHHAAAAVLATRDVVAERDGLAREMVEGTLLGEARARAVDVGDIPSGPPPPSFWERPHFALPVFRPPRIDPAQQGGIAQLGVDRLLVQLLGDRL